MSYWKVAGLSYLQYITHATTALRNAVKPSLASKYLVREEVHFKQQIWHEGKAQTERVLIKIDPLAVNKTKTQSDGGNA